MLLQIILHTPRWVFVLFGLLAWLGVRQLVAHDPGLYRVTLMPFGMGSLSVSGLLSVFGDSPVALTAWTVAAGVLLALMLRRPLPATTHYDPERRCFHVAGSPVPLVLMMGLFLAKYGVGIALALHPELRRQAAFSLGVPLLYGAFSGVFASRAVRMWRLAQRTDVARSDDLIAMLYNGQPS